MGLGSTGNPVFVVPGSMLGCPVVTLPVLKSEGLPLGLQLLGAVDEDAKLFALAAWVEMALAA
jgi:Asp-tRNA(Asn)/Glu-tRNA(Gln) amidotransferase A subunit family amidase